MTDDPEPEEAHWLDRLALRYTRRQAIKAAAGAGVALTAWPLLNAVPARAEDPHACQQGCLWTSHETASDRLYSNCFDAGLLTYLLVLGYAPALGLGFLSFPASGAAMVGTLSVCRDKVLLQEKAENHECLQPNCPGFNPKGANGPCEGVTDYCCPCSTVIQGYQPCVYPCDDPEHDCCG